MTDAGRVNLFGIAAVALVVIGAGFIDAVQVVVRIFRVHYETGLPSVLTFLWVLVVLVVACTVVLAGSGVLSSRQARSTDGATSRPR